jgi:hypothetical protein
MKHAPAAMKQMALVLSLVIAVPAPAEGPDPAIGKWYGTAGGPENRSGFGLEITAAEDEGLWASIYLEVMNYFGQALPSIKPSGNRYSMPDVGLDLSLEGDRMAGTVGKAPVELKRTRSLPTEPPVPADLPIGPGPRWKTPLGGAIYAAAAVRDGFAYVGGALCVPDQLTPPMTGAHALTVEGEPR